MTTEGASKSITFVCTSLFKGGAETQLVRLALGLSQRGWSVKIVTIMDLNDFVEPLLGARIEVETLGIPRGKYDPRSLPKMVSILRRHAPNIVCTFMYHANVLGRVAARIAGVPIVVSSIRNAIFGGWVADRLMRATDRLANVTTTNSELAAKALLSRGVVSPSRLRVVKNAIDLTPAQYVRVSRDELVGAEVGSSWLWLSVGRLEPQKAHENTIRAIGQLTQRGADVHLAIAGNGGLHRELAELRDSLGLRDRVSFLDYRNDVKELMSVSDGLVLASRWEGLPNSILEACLANLPVVATSVGGVEEIIADGDTGLVVPPDDVDALADAMFAAISLTQEERTRMTHRARDFVEKSFSPEQVISTWENLFFDQLGTRKVPVTG